MDLKKMAKEIVLAMFVEPTDREIFGLEAKLGQSVEGAYGELHYYAFSQLSMICAIDFSLIAKEIVVLIHEDLVNSMTDNKHWTEIKDNDHDIDINYVITKYNELAIMLNTVHDIKTIEDIIKNYETIAEDKLITAVNILKKIVNIYKVHTMLEP